MVDDGNGGQEPRFSLNVNLNNRRDAMQVIRDICSVMRAIPYYEEGTIKVAQDAPKDHANPSALSFDYVFNNANVIGGDFYILVHLQKLDLMSSMFLTLILKHKK